MTPRKETFPRGIIPDEAFPNVDIPRACIDHDFDALRFNTHKDALEIRFLEIQHLKRIDAGYGYPCRPAWVGFSTQVPDQPVGISLGKCGYGKERVHAQSRRDERAVSNKQTFMDAAVACKHPSKSIRGTM